MCSGSRTDTSGGFAVIKCSREKFVSTALQSRTGELLVAEKIITQAQLDEALTYQEIHGGRIGACLVELGFATEEAVVRVLARRYGVAAIDLSTAEVDLAAIKLVPLEIARKHNAVPIGINGSTLVVAVASPNNLAALDELRFVTGRTVRVVVAPHSQILSAIDTLYAAPQNAAIEKLTEDLSAEDSSNVELLESEQEELDLQDLERASSDSSITRFVNLILLEAVKRGASDIHIEPYENEVRVRYRVDGELGVALSPPVSAKNAVTSRLKVMAKLDIAEKRRPQDGRIKIRCRDVDKTKELDFRVSTLPTLFGEKIVMRMLDRDNLTLDLDLLGFEPESLKAFDNAIRKPFGIILVTGPTGSGKTNTLYSAISRLNSPNTNIMTVEDPVEFVLPGINQTQVQEQIGSTFASTLRAFLRQDPDVILVGEIRDTETSAIAVKASLTGHLVLSTLHTNDAASAINRLIDMGIEPFLLSTSINLICGQRLVRRICSACKEETEVPWQTLRDIGFTDEEAQTIKVYRGAGCKVCNKSGYKGRLGLFEVMDVTTDLKHMIASGRSTTEIKNHAIENGMITLRRSGLVKIKNGLTTLDEVLAETVL
jgi:type IV pilus assembly protein PilB